MSQFLILITLLIATGLLLQLEFAFYIAYVCAGLYVWSRWYTPLAMRRLRIARRFADHAFLGEPVPVTLSFTNTGWLRLPWLQYHEGTAVELPTTDNTKRAFSLSRGETAVFTYQIHAMKRGYYRVGPLYLSSSDLFGLAQEQRSQLPPSHLTVYPRLIPLSQLGLPSRLPFGTVASQQRLFADPARPMGVREFRSGDSLRQINWKVSAHTRDLMVKTLQPAISLETAVLLNLHLGDYQRQERYHTIEWAITVAASLAAHLSQERQAVGLLSNGTDPLRPAAMPSNERMMVPLTPRTGRAHLMKLLEQLARIAAEDTVPFNQWGTTACQPLNWGVTLLVVTASGDEATCQTLHRLVRSGYNPILLLVEPSANFGLVRQRAHHLGFAAFQVIEDKDLRVIGQEKLK